MPRQPSAKFSEALTLASIIREKASADQCAEHLKPFLKAAWTTIEPGVPFTDGWHIDCICDHVEALFTRQIRRLIINISPRSTKSTIISIAAPAWRWIKTPEESFLCGSFGKKLALNFSRKTRSLIKSPWYQSRWGSAFALTGDQDEKGEFENDKGGYRLSASVEGGVLGRGGSFAIYDDPNDLSLMKFPDYRQSVKDWYSGSASSRHINPKTDVRLCVQQRASYGDDLTSFLLELGGWEHVVIPNEFDGRRPVWPIGNIDVKALFTEDPRTYIGELMCPERMGPEETAIQKRESRDNYQGQFQQIPVSDTGGVVKREWFRFYNPEGVNRVNEKGDPIPVIVRATDGKNVEILPITIPPAFEQAVQGWDMAFKNAEHNDYVAGHVWGRVGANAFMLAREHGHLSFTESKAAVRRMSAQFPCPEKLVESAANGPAIIDELHNEIPGLIAIPPFGSKESRYAAISGYIKAGNVFLPNPDLFPWVWEVLAEFCDGRAAKHDDDRDAMAMCLKCLYDSMAQSGVPEFRVQPRLGEPGSACHISREVTPVNWRRFVAIVPGAAAIWLSETPSGSLRVLRELSLAGIDAAIAGREIGRLSLPDAVARMQQLRVVAGKRQAYELILPKEAFAPIEPTGSYAEMLENAVLGYEPEVGDFDTRQDAKIALRECHFRSEMVEERDASLDRLRALLAFQPPDFALVPYNRQKALQLAETDLEKYQEYMNATDGKVTGEWPRLKISPECPQLIAELGSFRKDKPDEVPGFVTALLLGVSAPLQFKPKNIIEKPVTQGNRKNQTLLGRKFSMGR